MVAGLTTVAMGKMTVELVLGICIKLFIENGRIHWSDFVNDFLFWLPMVDQQDGGGASREYIAQYGEET